MVNPEMTKNSKGAEWAQCGFRLRTYDVDGNEMILDGGALPTQLVMSYLNEEGAHRLHGRSCRELSVAVNEGYVNAMRMKALGLDDFPLSQGQTFERFAQILRKHPSATLLIVQ